MWQCGNVAMWQCGNVAMWQCGNVAMWQCGNVAMWQCGNVAMWKSGSVAVWHCAYVEEWKSGSVEVWKSGIVQVLDCSQSPIFPSIVEFDGPPGYKMPVGGGGVGHGGRKKWGDCNSFTLSRVQGRRPNFGASANQIS